MARRRATRRLTHSSGASRPLEGVQDVGPSAAPPVPAAAPKSVAAPTETLEERQERWFRERERYERRRAAEPPPT